MKRREFFKNIGNLGALSAGAAALSAFSQQAKADLPSAYGGKVQSNAKYIRTSVSDPKQRKKHAARTSQRSPPHDRPKS